MKVYKYNYPMKYVHKVFLQAIEEIEQGRQAGALYILYRDLLGIDSNGAYDDELTIEEREIEAEIIPQDLKISRALAERFMKLDIESQIDQDKGAVMMTWLQYGPSHHDLDESNIAWVPANTTNSFLVDLMREQGVTVEVNDNENDNG